MKFYQIFIVALLFLTQVCSHSNPIIILLSHPRSLSTAFERIIREREDMIVLHEPFTYLYYLKNFPNSSELSDFPANFSKTYSGLKNWIFELSKEKTVFIKDMGFSVIEYFKQDKDFVNNPNVSFVYLIRHPIKVLPSLYKIMPDASLEFIGYEALYNLKDIIPIKYIFDADDLENKPEIIYNQFCNILNITKIAKALSFQLPPSEDWKGDWYTHISASKEIEKSNRIYNVDKNGNPLFEEIDPKNRAKWLGIYKSQLPFFTKLKALCR